MKGNEKVIEKMNALLSDELAASNQYILHAEICANWKYGKLHDSMQKRAIDEMKHAERLIERILFLEGRPVVSKLGAINIGIDVEEIFKKDWAAEKKAVDDYNGAIKTAQDLGDNGTKELLDSILGDEESHIDVIEAQRDQIAQMGIATYLSQQI
ncbi:MAG: bacterioferritin [Candidatus Hydrogenedentales bacterium]